MDALTKRYADYARCTYTMSIRSDGASIEATKSTSTERLDAVLRAGQAEAERRGAAAATGVGGPLSAVKAVLKRAQVSDSRTALEHCQQNAKEREELRGHLMSGPKVNMSRSG